MPSRDRLGSCVFPRRASVFLLLVGGWSWAIWPTFLRNIWKDTRSFDDGPTPFFIVHAVLTAVSLVIGTAVGVLGWRGLRTAGTQAEVTATADAPTRSPDRVR